VRMVSLVHSHRRASAASKLVWLFVVIFDHFLREFKLEVPLSKREIAHAFLRI
jgi:hypothetical protein